MVPFFYIRLYSHKTNKGRIQKLLSSISDFVHKVIMEKGMYALICYCPLYRTLFTFKVPFKADSDVGNELLSSISDFVHVKPVPTEWKGLRDGDLQACYCPLYRTLFTTQIQIKF